MVLELLTLNKKRGSNENIPVFLIEDGFYEAIKKFKDLREVVEDVYK